MKNEEKGTESRQQKSSAVSQWLPIGMCLGCGLGVAFGNLAMGISLGMLFGLVIGSALDQQKKKNSEEKKD